jgi:hypothetical protein
MTPMAMAQLAVSERNAIRQQPVALAARATHAEIVRDERKGEAPSEHPPVMPRRGAGRDVQRDAGVEWLAALKDTAHKWLATPRLEASFPRDACGSHHRRRHRISMTIHRSSGRDLTRTRREHDVDYAAEFCTRVVLGGFGARPRAA